MATHSTEIIAEAETDDIVVVNKRHRTAKRIQHPSQLEEVFALLGSNLNPVLTQLAKTRRVLFVEGKDFQILSKFAQKLRHTKVANRSDFAVVPVEGFNPERIRSLKLGMETTLGGNILAAAVLDMDYRSEAECKAIAQRCKPFCDLVSIHSRKEIENFLLVPSALDRAAIRRLADKKLRTGNAAKYMNDSGAILEEFSTQKKSHVVAQRLACRRNFERANSSRIDEAQITEAALVEIEEYWTDSSARLFVIPGKDALSSLNEQLQRKYGVSITPTAIIDAMKTDEIPSEIAELVEKIDRFACTKVEIAGAGE